MAGCGRRVRPMMAVSSFARASVVATGLGLALVVGCSLRPAASDAAGASANLTSDGGGDGGAITDAAAEAGAFPALPAEWPNNGSADCRDHVNADPSIYTFKYD